MSKKEAFADNSISRYHAFQEIQRRGTYLCFQEAYNCRGRQNTEKSIGISLVSHDCDNKKQNIAWEKMHKKAGDEGS